MSHIAPSGSFLMVGSGLLIQVQTTGLSGSAPNWFTSCLSVRILQVVSDAAVLDYGVPQGSVLGPILFSNYVF